MAQTVAQHSVASFTSPVNGTSPIDANQVRGNDNTLRTGYNEHDSDPGIHLQSSALASRPVAGEVGRKWMTTDTGAIKVFFDTGSTWSEISYLPLSGGTVGGNVSITGTLAVTNAITATGGVVGNVTGNADTATKLSSSRTFAVTGDVTGSVSSDLTSGASIGTTLGSGVVVNANVSNSAAIAYSKLALTGSIVDADISASAAIADTKLDTISTAGKVANSATTAASANTASAIVARDASGNFSAGTITAALSGNASTATALQTARTINGTSFDGTANITVTAAAGTLTGSTLASGVTASSLTSLGTLTSLAVSGTTALNGQTYTWPSGGGSNGQVLTTNGSGTLSWTTVSGGGGTTTNSLTAGSYLTGGSFNGSTAVTFAVDATDANTASKVVARDASGNFSAGTITATLSGTATNASNLTGTSNAIRSVTYTFPASQGAASTVLTNDGSGNLSWATPSAGTAAAGTLTGTTLASNVVNSSLTSVGTLTSLAVTNNVGIGTTTSAWASTYRAVQVGQAGAVFGMTNDQDRVGLTSNCYFDTTDNRWEYIGTGLAARYEQNSGLHEWYRAASGSANGAITWTQSMTLNTNGSLLLATTNESNSVGNGIKMVPDVNGVQVASVISGNLNQWVLYNTAASAYRFYVNQDGTIFATSTTITAISDARLKENIRDLDDGLNAILSLKPRRFDWKENKGRGVKNDRGFIAQEFAEVFPDLVDTWESSNGEEPYQAIRPDIIPVLVKAIQELTARVVELESR